MGSAPSFSTHLEPTRPYDTVVLVADPIIDRSLFPALESLPGARAELKAVQPLFFSSVLLQREDATKDRILNELEQADVFVFAGHAVNNAGRPSRSHLVVAPAPKKGGLGLLLAEDLAGRSFERLRVVVLSACTSVGPKNARGSSVTGMARPFLRAGVQSVVGSLWRIEDGKTEDFLPTFYKALASGDPAAKALRRAQLKIVGHQREGWKDMSSWSSFAVVNSGIAAD